MTINTYQKQKENFHKRKHERYQNLSEEENSKMQQKGRRKISKFS